MPSRGGALDRPGIPRGPETAASPEPEAGRSEPESPGPVPWEDPERPRLTGFFQTLGEIWCRPAAFFARPARDGLAEPLAFGLIIGTAGSLLALFWWLLLWFAAAPGLQPALEMARMAALGGVGAVVAVMVLTPLAVLAKLALGSLCLWGAVALLGARVGFAPVWRILCYATAGMALTVVPFLGAPLAALMVIFISYQGIRTTLGMSWGRALGALAVFLILQALVAVFLLGSLLALLALLGLLLLG